MERGYGKKKVPVREPTQEEIAAIEAEGWIQRLSKQNRRRKKQGAATDDSGTRATPRGGAKSRDFDEENRVSRSNKNKKTTKRGDGNVDGDGDGAGDSDTQVSSKPKNQNRNKNKQKKKKKSKEENEEEEKMGNVDRNLVKALSRIFSAASKQEIKDVIIEMNLSSFDPNDDALKTRVLNALIDKHRQKLLIPLESDSEIDETTQPTEERIPETQDTPKEDYTPAEIDIDTGLVSEEVKEKNSSDKKKKKRPKKRKQQDTDADVDGGSEEMKTNLASNKNDARSIETRAHELILSELHAFDPSHSKSIKDLLKWKNQMQQNPIAFVKMFRELKGLEILIDKWIYCDHFRSIVCEREFVELLSWLLPGDRDYHEYVMSQIIEICKCLDTLNGNKKQDMRNLMSNHCKQLLQVQTNYGIHTSKNLEANLALSSTHSLHSASQLLQTLLPKPSLLLPMPSGKDPLHNKMRELDTGWENLSLVYQTLYQQKHQLEQMKPTNSDSFRKAQNAVKSDVNGRRNILANERMKLQNHLQLVEHEQKTLESNIDRLVTPLQSETNKIATDIRALLNQQKEYEQKLFEINSTLEQLNTKHKQLNDKIEEVKTQYAPEQEQVHLEHQNCSFQNVMLEKKNQCYECLLQLTDESWRKLEEWKGDFMEKNRDESDVYENQFIEQCSNYIYLLLEDKSFLINRVDHLKHMINDTLQHQLRTKQLYGDTLMVKSLDSYDGNINIYEKQAFDTQVLEWIDRQLEQVIAKCRDTIRKTSYQRFISQLNISLATNGYDAFFLQPFVDELNKEAMFAAAQEKAHNYTTHIHTATNTLSNAISSSNRMNWYNPNLNADVNSNINTTDPNIPNSNINSSTIHSANFNTNFNSNPTSNSNLNLNKNPIPATVLNINSTLNTNKSLPNRKPPMHTHGVQTEANISSQTQAGHSIPVFPKRGVITKPPVASTTSTQTTTNLVNTNVPSSSQNDESLAQRMRNSQRRMPASNETHLQ